MLLNEKRFDTAHKLIWAEAVHTCKHVINSMDTTGSNTSLFEKFYGEKMKIIGSFSKFGHIEYITKWDKFRKQMTDKRFKSIMVGYADNHTRDTNKLYNPDTKRVIITRAVKWADWKITEPEDTLNLFRESHKYDLVPGIK